MQIDYNILIAYGGFTKKYDKGEIIFREGGVPYFFYQVIHGEVKVFSTNSEGKDLIQGMFKGGESFGEPPVLLGKNYPSTAKASTPSVILKISKERFLNLLEDYPEIMIHLLYTLAERIYNKSVTTQIWLSHTPEEKLLHFLNTTKKRYEEKGRIMIPYTRQQIADFTGLRVETVIRTFTRMNKEGKISIINHKVYY